MAKGRARLIHNEIDLKELIAAQIFDYEDSDDYVRPSEGDCHGIAKDIIILLKNEGLVKHLRKG